ncbi:MAG: hypothetical protein LIO72_05000 [Ruminococcus sp.]|nr:hypothetical protein [Ruminococcus sp.]
MAVERVVELARQFGSGLKRVFNFSTAPTTNTKNIFSFFLFKNGEIRLLGKGVFNNDEIYLLEAGAA